MLRRPALRTATTKSTCIYGRSYTSAHAFKPVPLLPSPGLNTFRDQAFHAEVPALLPRHHFADTPAIRKWFITSPDGDRRLSLNRSYLARFGSTTVPLEITHGEQFTRLEQSLSFFLECVHASTSSFQPRPNRYFSAYTPGARAVKRKNEMSNNFFSASTLTAPTARVYLAQVPIPDLPQGMRDDVPTPTLVLEAGKGDVYESSIWLGDAPTYTPLHRDPNPNLFVQLAGRKVVRLFPPQVGKSIFAKVQESIGGSASATIRGEEMMQGLEKKALADEVWGDGSHCAGWQAELDAGDGLFIPKGWWHSVKGIGKGMTGSVRYTRVVLKLAQ